MEIILSAGYTFLFLFLIGRTSFYQIPGLSRIHLKGLFLLKVVAGTLLGIIYTIHYPTEDADTFKFFNDSGIIFNTLFTKPGDFFSMFTGIGANNPELRHYYLDMDAWLNKDVLFNDNKTIIRLNTFFRFFSLGHYYVHVVFINFISFTGLICMYKTFLRHIKCDPKLLFLLTMLIPSLVFWGSGVLKDGLLLFALGFMLYAANRIISRGPSLRRIIILGGSLGLLLITKFYVIVIILPGLIAWFWARNQQGKVVLLKFGVLYIVYLAFAFNLYHFIPKYNLAEIIYYKQKNFYVIAEIEQAKSVIQIPLIEPVASSILIHSPGALIAPLTRPYLTDVHGDPLILFSALENLFILFICFIALISLYRNKFPTDPFFIFCLSFVILMFILIGLITPVLGAMVRYKVPALPFLLFILLRLITSGPFMQRLPLFKKYYGASSP